jgi:hypothetical protein
MAGLTCCGNKHTTRYCPDCGKPLVNSPAAELLAYCRRNEEQYQARVNNGRERHQKGGPKGDHWLRVADLAEPQYQKWKAWGDALASLINSIDDKAKPDPAVFLSQHIAVLRLGTRINNALLSEKIELVGQLVAMTADEFLVIRNVSLSSLEILRERLAFRGLKLRGD